MICFCYIQTRIPQQMGRIPQIAPKSVCFDGAPLKGEGYPCASNTSKLQLEGDFEFGYEFVYFRSKRFCCGPCYATQSSCPRQASSTRGRYRPRNSRPCGCNPPRRRNVVFAVEGSSVLRSRTLSHHKLCCTRIRPKKLSPNVRRMFYPGCSITFYKDRRSPADNPETS